MTNLDLEKLQFRPEIDIFTQTNFFFLISTEKTKMLSNFDLEKLQFLH